MKKIILFLSILNFSVVCQAQVDIKNPKLGFDSVDFSSEFWTVLKDDHKLKGSVPGILKYEDIQKITVLRCYMSVYDSQQQFLTLIRKSISPTQQFSLSQISESASKELRAPLLTVLIETKKGELGLLSIYSGISILEFGGQTGLIIHK